MSPTMVLCSLSFILCTHFFITIVSATQVFEEFIKVQSIQRYVAYQVEGQQRHTVNTHDTDQGSKRLNTTLKLNGFTWKDCGKTDDPIKIKSMSASPDPFHIPGNVTVGGSGLIKKTLSSPLEMSLSIEKKMFIWVTVPCIDDVGSCTYEDICTLLQQFDCPPVFQKYGIPCRCPIKAGSYSLPPSTIDVEPFGIPEWLESGDYKVTAQFAQNNAEVGCVHVEFSLA